jgi:diguanylate cyclase (GGDEF)-like protein
MKKLSAPHDDVYQKNQQKDLKDKLKLKNAIRDKIRDYQCEIRLLERLLIEIDHGHELSNRVKDTVEEVKIDCYNCITNRGSIKHQIRSLETNLIIEKSKYKEVKNECEILYKELKILQVKSEVQDQQNVILQKKVYTDPLTKIPNRIKFYKIYKNEIEKLKLNNNRKLTLALIDIDNFKIVNDTYGHPVGDKVLQDFCSIIQEELSNFSKNNKNILFFRYGWEEFAILSKISSEILINILEEILTKLNAKPMLLWENRVSRIITFSGWVSESNWNIAKELSAKDLGDKLITMADKNLYKAKNTWKSKVINTEYTSIPQNSYKA